MAIFKNTRATEELKQIIALQRQNLPGALSAEDQRTQGFLTVQHNIDLLQRMAQHYGHAVAMSDERVVGYALVMLPEFGDEIDILRPMFVRLDQLTYQGQTVSDYRFFIMGQICVAYGYRGKGVFAGLYQQLRASLSTTFDIVVTEVSTRNLRSLRAHEKVGFRTLETYTAGSGETWSVLLWDWHHPG